MATGGQIQNLQKNEDGFPVARESTEPRSTAGVYEYVMSQTQDKMLVVRRL